MARPIKDDADFFGHDKNMRNDEKVKALRKKFGITGYALWCMLLEKLTDAPYFKLKFSDDVDKELLAGDFDLDVDQMENIILYMLRLGMLKLNEGHLYSEKLIAKFDRLLSRRSQDRTRKGSFPTGKPSNEESFPDGKLKENEVIRAESTERKEKKSKVNNSTGKQIEFIPQFEDCWLKFERHGSKKKSLEYWKKLRQEQRDEIEAAIPAYVAATTDDTRYRKYFEGWINPENELWTRPVAQLPQKKITAGDRLANGFTQGKF